MGCYRSGHEFCYYPFRFTFTTSIANSAKEQDNKKMLPVVILSDQKSSRVSAAFARRLLTEKDPSPPTRSMLGPWLLRHLSTLDRHCYSLPAFEHDLATTSLGPTKLILAGIFVLRKLANPQITRDPTYCADSFRRVGGKRLIYCLHGKSPGHGDRSLCRTSRSAMPRSQEPTSHGSCR